MPNYVTISEWLSGREQLCKKTHIMLRGEGRQYPSSVRPSGPNDFRVSETIKRWSNLVHPANWIVVGERQKWSSLCALFSTGGPLEADEIFSVDTRMPHHFFPWPMRRATAAESFVEENMVP